MRMNYEASRSMGRRRFMEYLLQSPLVLAAGSIALSSIACHTLGTGVKSGEVINVFDLMELAKKNLSTAHWEYLMTGVEDNLTRQANLDGFRLFQIRPRRFVDTEQVDTSVQIFGQRYPSSARIALGSIRRTEEKSTTTSPSALSNFFPASCNPCTTRSSSIFIHTAITAIPTTIPLRGLLLRRTGHLRQTSSLVSLPKQLGQFAHQ